MVIPTTAAPRKKLELTLFQQGEKALMIVCDDLRIRNLLKGVSAEEVQKWAKKQREDREREDRDAIRKLIRHVIR